MIEEEKKGHQMTEEDMQHNMNASPETLLDI
jgi:hypothetical protein